MIFIIISFIVLNQAFPLDIQKTQSQKKPSKLKVLAKSMKFLLNSPKLLPGLGFKCSERLTILRNAIKNVHFWKSQGLQARNVHFFVKKVAFGKGCDKV